MDYFSEYYEYDMQLDVEGLKMFIDTVLREIDDNVYHDHTKEAYRLLETKIKQLEEQIEDKRIHQEILEDAVKQMKRLRVYHHMIS